jgi:hypothetical protein
MKYQVFFVFLLISFSLYSQDIEEITEKNEVDLGINLNTHAHIVGGITLNYYFRKTTQKSSGIMLEFVNIKYPKEIKQAVGNSSSASYIYGKYNNLLTLRTLYSKRFLLFNKSTDEGVELSLNTAAGVAWGFKKPYYVYLQNDSILGSGYYKYKDVRNNQNIAGSGGLLRGLNESTLVPGGSFRLSGVLEFGFLKENPIGVEIGTQIDAYSQKIELINYAPPKNVFITGFIVLYVGLRW